MRTARFERYLNDIINEAAVAIGRCRPIRRLNADLYRWHRPSFSVENLAFQTNQSAHAIAPRVQG